MTEVLVKNFIVFFSVIDPIGTIPVFIAVTSGIAQKAKRAVATKAALTAMAVMLFFIIAGELVLDALGVPLASFQIAGGIVLFLFALTMIFGESKPESEIEGVKANDNVAIFPLAMPSLASPGAIMAAILLTENSENSIADQSMTALMMILVVAIAWALMMLASQIYRLIGSSGAAIISRVMGLILCAVAIDNILAGFFSYIN